MKANLVWDGIMGFTASGDSGHNLKLDVAREVGGTDSGPRPLELVLYGLGGCSGADVVSILKKMKQDLTKFTIEINGVRASDYPKKLTNIHLIYRLSGNNLNSEKVQRAIELSMTKYCSVAASLNAEITYEMILE